MVVLALEVVALVLASGGAGAAGAGDSWCLWVVKGEWCCW